VAASMIVTSVSVSTSVTITSDSQIANSSLAILSVLAGNNYQLMTIMTKIHVIAYAFEESKFQFFLKVLDTQVSSTLSIGIDILVLVSPIPNTHFTNHFI